MDSDFVDEFKCDHSPSERDVTKSSWDYDLAGAKIALLRIELLSFEGCPNRAVAIARIQAALDAERMTADVTDVLVSDPDTAVTLRFLGSPSVRVDGVDVEPAARTLDQFGFMCRTYLTYLGSEGAPPTDMIRAALRAHLHDRFVP